jgi:hypothetical protein
MWARQRDHRWLIRRMCNAYWITKATQKLRICNTYYFSTARMVMWKRLIVTFTLTLPILLFRKEHVTNGAVLWLRRKVASLSPRAPELDPKPVRVGFLEFWFFSECYNRCYESEPGEPPKGGGLRAVAPSPTNRNLKKIRFVRHDNINIFTWFTLQRKSATEIGRWLLH